MEPIRMTRSPSALRRLPLSGLALLLAAGVATAQPAQPAATTKPAAAAAEIDPAATQALQRMRAFMSGMNTFQVKTDGSRELVLDDGQKVQLVGGADYTVRRPNGFEIKTAMGDKVRTYVYDGQKMTVYAPQLGYYAQAAAPPTIQQTLDEAYDKYGISFPLEDLFKWAERDDSTKAPITSAMVVGDATIDGTPTTQYAFRQGPVDWQVWIQKGAEPLPRKIVIVDRTDEARPAYSATLAWTVNPTLPADAFVFQPGKDAKRIQIAAAQ